MAFRRSSWRSCPWPLRFRQIVAAPTAAPIMGMEMQAPNRCRLGRIGSSPTKVILPPASDGSSPRTPQKSRNLASMSNDRLFVDVESSLLAMWNRDAADNSEVLMIDPRQVMVNL